MRLQNAQDSVSVYLGLDVSALRSRSWYSLLHPQDLSHASAQHCSLLREGGEGRSEMVVRVESADQSWVWLYMVLQLEAGDSPISSNNYILSEAEAWSVRQQLSTEQTQLTLVLSTSTSRQDSLSLSSPDQVFTPSSSGLSAQSFDFSMTVSSVGSSDETGGATTEPMQVEGDPRSSISSIEEESFFQQQQQMPAPVQSPSAASSPTPVTVATVADLDFLTQNILLPPSFQLEPPLPAFPLPLPPVPTSQEQQTKEFVCTPPYTPQLGGGSFLGSLYEKLPPTPDSPGDGDCTVMTLPEVRGPLYVDVPLGPLHYPLEGLLTPEASPDTAGVDSIHMLGEFYPVKAWRGLDFPIFHDDDSLFEESILEALLQDFSTPPPLSPTPSIHPPSPPNPVCWHSPSHLEGVSHFCSVQSAYCNPTAGCGVTLAGEAGAMAEVEGLAEEPMEIEVASSPLSSCSSIPASPPLRLTASPTSAPSTPVDPSTPAVPCAQSLLEELAALEPMFGAGASIAPGLGQQPELYQLQCHQPPQCFHKDGSGSVPPF
ncbi:hypothetical protein J4Q44_G00303990 [Coregonus suidteri]|uniref:PAS fold-3 domain-containing protein n=1 Tax=Coregonus suidteri TaxID=861788 RepID=A0AAN8L0W1_9TELE